MIVINYCLSESISQQSSHHAGATQLIRKANHVAWLLHETNAHQEELPKRL